MKNLVILLFILFTLQHANAQLSGKVTGTDGSPIPFAIVSLMHSTDSSLVHSAVANERGLFQLNAADSGVYLLKVSNIGFNTYTSPAFTLTTGNQSKSFGTIILQPAARQLSDVVIHANKPLVSQQSGGLVVNVQNSVLTKGSSVLEVLERSPGVILDPRNNSLSLNGKSGVMVMLDGKLIRLPMQEVVSLLNGMSADNIANIELLNTPPAKYDADGSAGLINIVTKKNKKPGTNGSYTLTGGYGKGEKASAAFNLSHTSDNTNWYTNYAYTHDRTYGQLLATGTEDVGAIGGSVTVHYFGVSKPITNQQQLSTGFDTRLTPTLTIGSSIDYTYNTNEQNHNNQGFYQLRPDSVLLFNSGIKGNGKGHDLAANIFAEKTISKDEKIRADADYIDYADNDLTNVQSSFVDNHGNPAGGNDSLYAPMQRDQYVSTVHSGIFQVDYSKSFNKNIKFEAGAKGTYTRSSGTSGIENLKQGQWVSSLNTSSSLITKETIGAAYASLSAQLDTATSLVAGARYEYSVNRATGINRQLGKLFPNISIDRKLSSTEDLQLSYTERISRPSFSDLASYITYNDPVSVFTGNPYLLPTITRNFKLNYSNHDNLFSLLYSQDDNPIVQGQVVTGPSKQLVYIAPENVSYQNNLTLQANISIKVNDWWQMNYNLTGGWRQFKIDYTLVPVEKSYLGYSLNFSETFQLPHRFTLELSGYYNTMSYYGVSKVDGQGMLNAGFKKDLGDHRGSLQLSITDVLRSGSYHSYIGALTRDAFDSKIYINYQPETAMVPVIKLSYFRSFGSTPSQTQKRNENSAKDAQDRIGN
ncbi:outer membrane beta-barrel protein [Mucilaginibacter sp. X5P1]|uniref:outer membrane beta-barrel family protein n=1 Tax=Mucilaginibacter sp. X5P1 TaxID=2723088 RepID=UPI00161AF2B4|nr:outer membrane beta-barrel family protein [Mucilaginibacter sp. X5P1]MBB6137462.1 hypothetical protein [Mucilaginibacter sp. X5P1]